MSTQPQQQPQMMVITCEQCKKEVYVHVPTFRVFNSADMSILGFTHTRVDRCQECGKAYLCLLAPQGLDPEGRIVLNFVPVDSQPTSPIITPSKENMEAAKKAQELARDLANPNKSKLN